ncbi:MAG: hypothetical protein ACYTBY_11145 [Planctomycetota bacterium]
MLSSPDTARKGNLLSAVGMLVAIATTLTAMPQISDIHASNGRVFQWFWRTGQPISGMVRISRIMDSN